MKYLTPFFFYILCGCVPWSTTLQPEVHLSVSDTSGKPIKNAFVKFAIYRIALQPEVKIIELHTNENGSFRLELETYTQMVALAPEGGHSYDWSYCIEKQGYRPIIRNSLTKKHFSSGTLMETMTPTSKLEQCQWQDYPHGFITKP